MAASRLVFRQLHNATTRHHVTQRIVRYTARMAKSLFEQSEAVNLRAVQPLAARMRPRTLEEFAGQQHFLGEG